MDRRRDSFFEILVKASWWVSVLFGIGIYCGLKWAVPAYVPEDWLFYPLAIEMTQYAAYILIFFILLAGLSVLFGCKKSRLLESQTSLESLKELSWKEFEWMVGEAYRRQGFGVEESLVGGPDGGIDIILRKGESTILVQCKRWKIRSVGVQVVRELFGIMVDLGADKAIIVTSGEFTREAKGFARGKSIDLVDGSALLKLVAGVKDSTM